MKQFENQLPKGLSKTINDLARTREKAAKQKYLLDLGESLVMHLSAFLIAEYKNSGVIHLELEKAFIKNNKNLSFGVYLNFIRESVKFLNQINKQSKIHQLLIGKNDFIEIGQFIKAYEAIKDAINNEKEVTLVEVALKKSTENAGKLNLLDFFNSFIEIRNRVAHPHKEVKGKHISWPFNEDYFDAINPFIEKALFNTITSLSEVWEFKIFTVSEFVDSNLLLESETGEITEMNFDRELNPGVKVILNPNQDLLIFDWKMLLKAGQEGIDAIKKEEDELRNKATIEDLKIAIESALDDNQISRDELNFFESIGKNKLNLTKSEVQTIILEVALSLNIEEPFPEVDRRFIEVIDDAIKNKTYNEFLLKLTGQQFGLDTEMFNRVFEERAFALNVDPIDVKENSVYLFTKNEFKDLLGMYRAQQWIMNIGTLNNLSQTSFYINTGDSYIFGTKEYWHRTAFLSLEKFVKNRVEKLTLSNENKWEVLQNKWQIGNLSSYAWTSVYPKGLKSGRILALSMGLHKDGVVFIGYLPDWKDQSNIENLGLLLHIFVQHLKEFAINYKEELMKYPDLVVLDTLNYDSNYSFLETSENLSWFFDYLYDFDEILFRLLPLKTIEQPEIIPESFDIVFNLFGGLFEKINQDYENSLETSYLIFEKEDILKNKLINLNPIFEKYQLFSITDNNENESIEKLNEDQDKIIGSAARGYLTCSFKRRIKKYPILIEFKYKYDYDNQCINFLIHISVAGYLEDEVHAKIEKELISIKEQGIEGTDMYFMRSRLLIIQQIETIENHFPEKLVDYFLNMLSEKCAINDIDFLGIKPQNTILESMISEVNDKLDSLKTSLETEYSIDISKERNLSKNYRYVDFISSNKKHGLHKLSWGVIYHDTKLSLGTLFTLENSLKGALLYQKMLQFIYTHKNWRILDNTINEDLKWLILNLKDYQLTGSSQFNNNYSPKKAIFDNTHYWKPLTNEKSWLQIELNEVYLINKIKIQGSVNGDEYLTSFNFNYSVDGKKWESYDKETNNDSSNSFIFDLEIPICAKFIKIIPLSWVKNVALRIDLFGKCINPDKIQIMSINPFNNLEDLANGIDKIDDDFKLIKQNFDGNIGF